MKTVQRYKWLGVSDVVFFILTNGILVYLGNTSKWIAFGIVLFICIAIYILLKIVEFKPVKDYFEKAEQHEFHFTSRMEPFGIEDIYNLSERGDNNRRIEHIRHLLAHASKIKYLGLTGFILINKDVKILYDDLVSFLDGGGEIYLMLLSPVSEEKNVRNQVHHNDPRYDLSHLNELKEKYNEQVKIRFTDRGIYCSLVFSDTEMFYDPYHLGKDSKSIKNRFFSLRLSKKDGSYYHVLASHYDTLWKRYSYTMDALPEKEQVHPNKNHT